MAILLYLYNYSIQSLDNSPPFIPYDDDITIMKIQTLFYYYQLLKLLDGSYVSEQEKISTIYSEKYIFPDSLSHTMTPPNIWNGLDW